MTHEKGTHRILKTGEWEENRSGEQARDLSTLLGANSIGDGRGEEYLAGGISHPGEDVTDFAILLSVAIIAFAISGDREAWQRRYRAIDDTQDLAESDAVGRLQQQIAALLAATTDYYALMLQVEQDLFQKLLRDLLLHGNVGNHDRFVGLGFRQNR